MDLNCMLVAIALILMVADVVCGVANAAKNGTLDSSIMREGLFHKFSEIMLIALAGLCQLLLEIDPLNALGIPAEVMYSVTVYIIAMELLSTLENICKINPSLPFAKVLAAFDISPNGGDVVEKDD